MSTSTLTSKGQTTIPKDVRKRLNLHPGSIDASELAGMLKQPAKPVTVTEMNHAIRKRAGRR
jgi:antitoxin PrlF